MNCSCFSFKNIQWNFCPKLPWNRLGLYSMSAYTDAHGLCHFPQTT